MEQPDWNYWLRAMYAWAMYAVKNRDLAEEAVQEACLSYLRQGPKNVSLRLRLFVLVRSRAIDLLRKRYVYRYRFHGNHVDGADRENVYPPTVEQIVMRRLDLAETMAQIRSLPPKHQTIILLKAAGYTDKEIAQAMGMSVKAAEMTHRRVRKWLREAKDAI